MSIDYIYDSLHYVLNIHLLHAWKESNPAYLLMYWFYEFVRLLPYETEMNVMYSFHKLKPSFSVFLDRQI